jgi:hypothetical protein
MGLAGGQFLGLLSELVYMLTYPPQTKKSKKKAKTAQWPPATTSATESSAPNGIVTSSTAAAAPANETGGVTKRHLAPQVEDVEDE